MNASRETTANATTTSTKNLAFSVATSMASSAATATAGVIATGAKAAKTAVVDRRNSSQDANNSNGVNETNPSMWSRLSWSKPNNNINSNNIDEQTTCETAVPSWTTASTSGISVGGNADYGENNHLETSRRQSLSAAWMARPKFRRRHTSPAVFGSEVDAKTAQLELYKSLLSTPPSTITFVIRRNENLGVASKTIRDLLGVRLVKSEETNHRFEVVRDDKENNEEHDTHIKSPSTQPLTPPLLPPELTVLLRSGDFLESIDGIPVGGKKRRLGMGKNRYLDEDDLYFAIASTRNLSKTKKDNTHETEYPTGEVEASASETEEKSDDATQNSYPTTTLTFVCGGTTLCPTESVTSTNDTPVAAESMESPTSMADDATSSVTMTTPLDVSSAEEESAAEPSPRARQTVLPTVHKAYFLDHTEGNDGKDLENGILDDFLALQTVKKAVVDPKTPRFGLGNSTHSTGNQTNLNMVGKSLLHIASIPENHWLGKQNKIKAGDILLCADDIPCYNGELSPGDLSLVWRTALMTKVLVTDPVQTAISKTKRERPPSYAAITTCNVPPTRLESFRKTAVAATGGALVGTGAVLMVTPLHPVGHAMAIGGLGVLGTEFEAPKKAFEKAKQSAVNLAAKVKKQSGEEKRADKEDAKDDHSSTNNEIEDKFVTL